MSLEKLNGESDSSRDSDEDDQRWRDLESVGMRECAEIKLSQYLDENEQKWQKIEQENAQKFIGYLNRHIDADLYGMAKTRDGLEVFRKLNGWLFNFYYDEFLDGLTHIGYSSEKYLKSLVYNFSMSVARDRSNADILYGMLHSKGVVNEMLVSEDDAYRLQTKDFGDVEFSKADRQIDDEEVEQYLTSLGERKADGCHEISYFLLERDADLKAVTSICMKGLGCKYYHSFVLNDQNQVIDLTANLIMPKKEYYILQNVEELNVVNYQEYLQEAPKSSQFDESGTLFGLLRNALFRQITEKGAENDAEVLGKV